MSTKKVKDKVVENAPKVEDKKLSPEELKNTKGGYGYSTSWQVS